MSLSEDADQALKKKRLAEMNIIPKEYEWFLKVLYIYEFLII